MGRGMAVGVAGRRWREKVGSRFVWSSVRLHTVTNKVPRFTGYNSPSGWRGRDGVRVESGGYERRGSAGGVRKPEKL